MPWPPPGWDVGNLPAPAVELPPEEQPAPVEDDGFLAAMNAPAPTGAFGLQQLAEPSQLASTKGTLDKLSGQYPGLAPTENAPRIDPSTAFGEQFGARPDLDAEIDEQLAGGEVPQAPLGQAEPLAPMSAEESAQFMGDRERETPGYIGNQQIIREGELNEFKSGMETDALKADETWQERNRLGREEAVNRARERRIKLNQRADELSQQEIDPVAGIGTGKRIAATLMAMLSGFVNPRGRNSGIDMITQMIDTNIDRQKANMANQQRGIDAERAAIGDELSDAGADYDDNEARRLGAYKRVGAMIDAELAKYDPKGSTAIRLAESRMTLQEKTRAAEAAAANADLKREIETGEYKLKVEKQATDAWQAKQQAALGWAANKRAKDHDILEAKKAGFVPDGKGKWKADPDKAADPTEALKIQKLSADTDKAKIDVKESEGKRTVIDAITGEPLGQALDEKRATIANEAQGAWHAVERNLKRMEVLRKEIGMTTGVSSKLRGADNDKRVSEYEALADQTAMAIAKLDDPSSVVRDEERKAIKERRVPMYNTITGEGPETAEGKQKALRDAARAGVKRAMTGANLQFDPSTYYNDEDAPDPTAAQSAQKAASTYKPAQLSSLGGQDYTDALTGEKVKTGGMGQKYLLNDVQVTAPIQAMEGMAAGGDIEALKFLQAIAADAAHPGSAMATEALSRVGSK